MSGDEINMLLNELDRDGDGEINYRFVNHKLHWVRDEEMAHAYPLDTSVN